MTRELFVGHKKAGKDMHARLCAICVSVVCLVGVASTATAVPIDYGDYLGTRPGEVDFLGVCEGSITDPGALFGAPNRDGNILVFSPTFASSSSDGSADTTAATLSFRVRAYEGTFLELIIIEETGEWSFTGPGTRATSASVNGLLTVADIDPGGQGILFADMCITPEPPYSLPGDADGVFAATVEIDLTGLGIRQAIVNFNNVLQTSSEPGTMAVIQKETSSAGNVPEPGTLALLGLGAVGLLAWRRRSEAA